MKTGTLIYTWLKGELIGTDEFGNRYYRSRGRTLHGRERRWVLYKAPTEASSVPPEWNSWLHHTTPEPLTERAAQVYAWQKGTQPNPTGSADAYLPQGHELADGYHAPTTSDYEAWRPR